MVLFTRPMATLIPPAVIESIENYGEKLGAAALASHRRSDPLWFLRTVSKILLQKPPQKGAGRL